MTDDTSDPPEPSAADEPLPEPDESFFFRASAPPETPTESHHTAPNPDFDRPGSNRQGGFDDGSPFFVTGITGVKEGQENG